MHPLRFPDNGIRAKVFVRKIGFKLRVMRLNRVELFYALVTAKVGTACGEGAATCMLSTCRQRWLATVRPLAGAPAMALVPARGSRLRPGPLQGATARRGSTRKGRHPRARSPAGAATLVTGVASPLQGSCRPQRAVVACARAAAAAA
ncbi:hypothetical protein GW17_00055348 [Ensete ventricosum]|nr:hypothetical protein GW17_00055348 [Ensete ventricosum]RZS20433.1 hypothetical protein BHM03_00052959 [Ensete ventricosum]